MSQGECVAETEAECAHDPSLSRVSGSDDSELVTIIQPARRWRVVDFRELWRYRELLYFLAWRDIKVRYKQTVLGALWAILQPVATMLVFTLFMGRLASDAPENVPYPLFVLGGLCAWLFFSNAVSSSAQSVVSNQNLVTKIYFPRLIIPVAAIGQSIVDFALSMLVFGLLIAYYAVGGRLSVTVGPEVFLAPLLILFLAIAAIGVGTLLAALTVSYRDFRHVVPFLLQLWMFTTPTIYVQAAAKHPIMDYLMPLNPPFGIIKNLRICLLGGELDWYALCISCVMGVLFLAIGCFYFRKMERFFADLI